MAKEDVLLFGTYGMRGTGKSYYEKLKEKDKEIERLKNILIEIKEIINNKYWFNWEFENDEVIKEVLEKIEGVDKE